MSKLLNPCIIINFELQLLRACGEFVGVKIGDYEEKANGLRIGFHRVEKSQTSSGA